MTDKERAERLATQVMGWNLVADKTYHSMGGAMFAVAPNGRRRFLWHLCDTVYSGEPGWEPWNDIAAAWEVVEKLEERFGCSVHIQLVKEACRGHFNHKRYVASVEGGKIEYDTPSLKMSVYADSAPEAICLVALKAVENLWEQI